MLFIFFTGLIIGSFLNVCIYRLPEGKSIISPPSHCPVCENRLDWWELIPVLSFMIQGGKCRHCNTKISFEYPLIELFTGIIFSLLYLQYDLSINFGIYILFASFLIVIAMIDFHYQIIPDKLSLSGLVIGIILAVFFSHINIFQALLGLVVGGGSLLLIAFLSKGGMGGGDIKLAALLGSFIGVKAVLINIFLAALFGSIVGIALMIAGQKKMKSKLPFGPFLVLGALLIIIWPEILNYLF